MTPFELRARALDEVKELGDGSSDPRGRALWIEERRSAVELLAALSEWNADLLRRAALEVAAEWRNPEVSRLLFDAAVSATHGQ